MRDRYDAARAIEERRSRARVPMAALAREAGIARNKLSAALIGLSDDEVDRLEEAVERLGLDR